MRSVLARAFAAVLVAATSTQAVHAQDATIALTDDDGNGVVTARALVAGGTGAGTGVGFARIELENLDGREHLVTVQLHSYSYQRCDVLARRQLWLTDGSARLFLPVPVPPDRLQLEVTVDNLTGTLRCDGSRMQGVVGLTISDVGGAGPYGLEALEAMPSAYQRTSAEQVQVQSRDLPADWRLYTTFSAVVLDGRSTLDGPLQDALRRYAFAGGTVVVAGPASMRAGPLRELAQRAEDGVTASGSLDHGLGRVVSIPPFGDDTTIMRERLGALPPLGAAVWPAASDLFETQQIEGLGKAPVTAFLMVILAFAVLVGPVNFILLRKRKQPLLALVTVPALGFATTFLILVYGIFHDGFGLRGAVTSWTVLDQVRHEAGTVSARTLFAGLAPNDLTMTADALVLSRRAGVSNDHWPDRWHWDADNERLDGGVLPSRTVTPLLSVQQGPARARLTVRRAGDTLEVLADGGVAPVGELVLRDLDGAYWSGDGGVLRRVASSTGAAAFEKFARASRRIIATRPSGEFDKDLPSIAPDWGAPGTYATLVAQAPWIDEHGLEVDYDHRAHYVFGRMHEEDFVR